MEEQKSSDNGSTRGTYREALNHEAPKMNEQLKVDNTENGTRLATRGMALSYVAPSLKNGNPTACIQLTDFDLECAKWKNSIILYVVGEVPIMKYLRTYIERQWTSVKDPEIFYHVEGYFVINLANEEEKTAVLCYGPYTIAKKPVIVKAWKLEFSFKDEVLKVIPLWIQLPNLALNYWGMDSLSRIGSLIGKPLFADECTTKQKRISYARMLVEVDMTKHVVYDIQIEDPSGKFIQQKVIYEWEPVFCNKCQQIGHNCEVKEKFQLPKETKKQWVPKNSKEVETVDDTLTNVQGKGKQAQGETKVWSIAKKTIPRKKLKSNDEGTSTRNVYTVLPIGEDEYKKGRDVEWGGDPSPLMHYEIHNMECEGL